MSSENSFIGKSLGNYRITDEIGSGSFGNVFQGQHTILTERTVAIKQLHSHLGSPEERDRFLEEARLLERLKHPHILHIFDVGIAVSQPLILTMEVYPLRFLAQDKKPRINGTMHFINILMRMETLSRPIIPAPILVGRCGLMAVLPITT